MSEETKRILRTLGILYILSPFDLMPGLILDDLIVLILILNFCR